MNQQNSGFGNQVFVVTGSTQGIGESIALALAREGAAGVVICGRNEANGARVKASVEGLGAAAEFVPADLGNPEDCRRIIAICDRRFGRIDGLVNAAGLTDRGTIDDTSLELWDRMFAINTRAPFLLMQEAVRVMRREGNGGAIVNIVTMSSHGGQSKLTAYCASKGALATLTKNVAHAVRFDRIRVNGINIGWTATPNEHRIQLAEGQPEDWLARAEAEQPMGRLIAPEDVANLTLFLLGPASGVMTGSVIDCDQMVMGAYE
ncbi:MAG: SDR family oxidoreductase [Alphaproteobacteria bacterium]|nr:SDR family oxidoreductase [Alphaproteobacteria bacterium]